jgi:hypothetical protein
LPLSFMRKTRAEPRLARIRMKAMATTIFMIFCRAHRLARNRSGQNARELSEVTL